MMSEKAQIGYNLFRDQNKIGSIEDSLIHYIANHEIPWIIKWEYQVYGLRIPQLGRKIWGQWWKKFDDSLLLKEEKPGLKIDHPSETAELISSLEKKKLNQEDKRKLKLLLAEEDEEDSTEYFDDLSDEDYCPNLPGYSEDPNKF